MTSASQNDLAIWRFGDTGPRSFFRGRTARRRLALAGRFLAI